MTAAVSGIPPFLNAISADLIQRQDYDRTGLQYDIFLDAGALVPAAEILKKTGFFLESITAADTAEGYLLVYHFDHWGKVDGMEDGSKRLAVRTIIPADAPVAPSLYEIYQGAEWHERETRDFYGIQFDGNPDPLPLLLPAEMEEEPPLRKTDKSRTGMQKLLTPGSILYSRPESGLPEFLTVPPS